MLYYLKKYPLTWTTIGVIIYLSFFKPPTTDMNQIPGIDKLVHTCMYGGLCFLIWCEYLRIHRNIDRKRMLVGGIILPIALSGIIELLQSYCTEHRGGDWLDFAANSLGVLLAALVGHYILRPLFWKYWCPLKVTSIVPMCPQYYQTNIVDTFLKSKPLNQIA